MHNGTRMFSRRYSLREDASRVRVYFMNHNPRGKETAEVVSVFSRRALLNGRSLQSRRVLVRMKARAADLRLNVKSTETLARRAEAHLWRSQRDTSCLR